MGLHRCSSIWVLAIVACGAELAPSPTTAIEVEAAAPAAVEAAPTARAADGLEQLIVARGFIRMVDCGHDGEVGELRCGYTVAGDARPAPLDRRLQLFLTEPPGLVLAAVDWEPARALGDHAAVMATCAFERRGTLENVHFGAAAGITGYRYLGALPVGIATECDIGPYAGVAETLRASHLLVSHVDAKSPRPTVTRSRDEAAARIAEISARLGAKEVAFSDAVAQYSDEPGAQPRRGDLGTFRPEMMVPEFALVVLATPIGARSAAFETSFGFHVVERQSPE